jgi:LAO/AO transport system kinase
VAVLDAAGYDVVVIETVGAGQDQIDVARATHTTIVVEAPGLGDDIQAIKAGIMEIADIFVVNKADHDGADRAVQVLEMSRQSSILEATPDQSGAETWQVPICKTNALDGTGIPCVISALEAHHSHLLQYGGLEEKERLRAQTALEAMLEQELVSRFLSRLAPGEWQELVSRVAARAVGLNEAIRCLLARLYPDEAKKEVP